MEIVIAAPKVWNEITNQEETIVAKKVVLGKYDSVDNYKDITMEEAEKIREKIQETQTQ